MKMLTVSLLVCVIMALTTADVENQTCSSCPSGWTRLNDRCFSYDPTVMTWANAERTCQERGGNLASVHNSLEYYVIQSVILSSSQAYPLTWLGGSDAQQEGTWLWSDGTTFDFTFWDEGQPDNRADAHCLLMNFGDQRKFDDQPCSYQKPFICVRNP